jgi:recombinational DNA repair protein (RecF pathway)
VLEPFADGTATFYFKPDRDLHTLSDFELSRERQALGRDLQRYAAASVLCELVLRLAPAERDLSLYSVLVGGLDALLEAAPGTVPGTALAACWSVVDVLGFGPDLSGCASCGDDLSARKGRLDVREGTLVCERCLPGGGVLPPSELDHLRRLAAGDPTGPGPSARQVHLLVEFIRHHAAEGIHLRSLDFLLAEEIP